MPNDNENSGFSMLKWCLITAGLVFVLIVGLLTVRALTITKDAESSKDEKKSSEVTLVEDDKTTKNTEEMNEVGEKEPNSTESGSLNTVEGTSESTTGSVSESSTEKLESSTSVKDSGSTEISEPSSKDCSLINVDEPALGDILETAVLVTGKDVHRVDNISYTYSLSLIFPREEGYEIIKYFCSKKIYDSVNSGETINVSYQLDESGLISITSVSR